MSVTVNFFRTMLKMPGPWLLWLALLMVANGAVPLLFIGTREGQMVLLGAIVGAAIQVHIFRSKGFVRLLGIGHLPWIPLVLWLWSRLLLTHDNSLFRYWLLSVVVLNTFSLIIDSVDVIRYLLGDREPTVNISGTKPGS